MKRILTVSALVISTAFSAAAMAGQQNDAVVGAVVGGGAGALIGHSVNGRDGALIGSAIGALTGVAIATSDRGGRETRTVVYEQPVVYREAPVRERVVVYKPQPVIIRHYEPRRVVVLDRKPGRGHGHGRDDWRHDRHERDYAWDDRGRDDRGRWH